MLSVLQTLDGGALLWIQENLRGLLDPIVEGYTTLGNTGLMWIVLSLAMLCWKPTRKAGVAALAAMVWCAAYGYTLEKVAYKPLRTAPRLSPLISAIGMSIFLQNYVLLAQTSDFVPFPNLLPEMDFLEHIGYVMGPSDFLILLVSTIAMVSLSLFILLLMLW